MTSRKRNKGKERKAKRAATKTEEWWRSWSAIGDRESGCNHGCVVPAQDHAVSRFMNKYCEEFKHCRNSLKAMMKTFEEHAGVWSNAEYRQMAIDIFLRLGTNMILSEDYNWDSSMRNGLGILLLECYDGNRDFDYLTARMAIKGSNFIFGGQRDALKFYSKRLPCSCLNVQYKIARKTLPKVRVCDHCENVCDRASLMTCGRCKVPMYCSRGCQVAGWPAHKKDCGTYIDIRKHDEKKQALSS